MIKVKIEFCNSNAIKNFVCVGPILVHHFGVEDYSVSMNHLLRAMRKMRKEIRELKKISIYQKQKIERYQEFDSLYNQLC